MPNVKVKISVFEFSVTANVLRYETQVTPKFHYTIAFEYRGKRMDSQHFTLEWGLSYDKDSDKGVPAIRVRDTPYNFQQHTEACRQYIRSWLEADCLERTNEINEFVWLRHALMQRANEEIQSTKKQIAELQAELEESTKKKDKLCGMLLGESGYHLLGSGVATGHKVELPKEICTCLYR